MKSQSWKTTEQLAKLEQNIEMKRGKFVSLINTPTVKTLKPKEKKEFLEYLKHDRKKHKFLLIPIIITLIGVIIFNPRVTGQVIFVGAETGSNLSKICGALFVASLGIFLAGKIADIKREMTFEKHAKIIQDITSKQIAK